MNQQTMLWEVLVPTIMRDKPVRLRHHKVWDRFVREITGGLTILHPARGQWINPETKELLSERVIPVRIACTRKQLQEILDFTIQHYNQIAVMAYLLSEEVVVKYRKEQPEK
jgi:hypothetical protein